MLKQLLIYGATPASSGRQVKLHRFRFVIHHRSHASSQFGGLFELHDVQDLLLLFHGSRLETSTALKLSVPPPPRRPTASSDRELKIYVITPQFLHIN